MTRSEINYDSGIGFRRDDSFQFRESEYIICVIKKFENGGKIAIIEHCQQTRGLALNLNFSEIDTVGTQRNIIATGLTSAFENNIITSRTHDLVVSETHESNHGRCVGGLHQKCRFRRNRAVVNIQRKSVILVIVVLNFKNMKLSCDLTAILNKNFFGLSFSYQ